MNYYAGKSIKVLVQSQFRKFKAETSIDSLINTSYWQALLTYWVK